jgi:hypothetical protein
VNEVEKFAGSPILSLFSCSELFATRLAMKFVISSYVRPLVHLILLVGLNFSVSAQEPVLEVSDGMATKQWTRAALLAESIEIQVAKDSAYKRSMSYRAVPFAKLMPNPAKYASVQFLASDGFVANISGSDLAGKGQAFLAIEPAESRWPAINPGNSPNAVGAGPFYLVWLTPEAGAITSEQWPYQVLKIRVELPLQQRFPQIVPIMKSPIREAQAKQVIHGMQVYMKHCAVCHTLNGGGDATIGPDLNLPFSPTEYFQETYLRKLIRDPSSVRSWKQSIMPGFDKKTMPDQDLHHLMLYLKHMAMSRAIQ